RPVVGAGLVVGERPVVGAGLVAGERPVVGAGGVVGERPVVGARRGRAGGGVVIVVVARQVVGAGRGPGLGGAGRPVASTGAGRGGGGRCRCGRLRCLRRALEPRLAIALDLLVLVGLRGALGRGVRARGPAGQRLAADIGRQGHGAVVPALVRRRLAPLRDL